MPNENTNYVSAIKLNETPNIVYNIKDQEARTILAGLSNYDDTALTLRVSALETTVGDINTILEEVL